MENLDENNKNVSLSLIAEYGTSDSESDDTETRSNHTGNEDSDAVVMSEMVLKNNIINACAHGPLSRPSVVDEEEDTIRHMIIDNSENGVVGYDVTEYRDVDSDESDDSSDSDIDSVKDIEEISSGDENEAVTRSEKPEPPKVQGELGLDDLPPIEDLAISLPAQETTKIGTIASIVDRLVIVRALPETPAVDLDSVLFLENGAKALGKVFDVFGPVTEPHYCVRFNSEEHAAARGAKPGVDVFIAPRSDHTSYVFLTELMKIKGSDASWLNDVEPPPHQVDYSDDEEERRAKKAGAEHKHRQPDDAETDDRAPKKPERRNQRPSESSSRFGGPSRGRNPFSAGSRRNPSSFQRSRPWNAEFRPTHPADTAGPFNFPSGPMFPPPFNPSTPPPFIDTFNYPPNPMQGGISMGGPPYRQGVTMGGGIGSFFNFPGPLPGWNNAPPPPPGT